MIINLANDRIQEAKERRLRQYQGKKIDKIPFIFGVSAPVCNAWISANPYSFSEMINDPKKAVEAHILSFNWQSENYPDSDWLPMFNTFIYGEGFVPSLFGAKQLIVEDNPPFTEGRILNSIEDVVNLPEKIDPDNSGWGPMVRNAVTMMLEAGKGNIPIQITDHQSPYGIATKLLGNEELIYAMYDEPELVHKLMAICTDALIDTARAMQRWLGAENVALNSTLPIPGEGGIILWDDYVSVINPELYTEFCLPYNKKVYETFGRGHLHTCGPYFEGYINSCVSCNPVSMDISSMRNLSRSREDMLKLRKITKEHGIILSGGLSANPVSQFESSTWQSPDENFFRQMADGGLIWGEGGTPEQGDIYKEWVTRFEI